MKVLHKIRDLFGGMPSRVKIGKKYVGPGEPVFIIAEIGINHNGDIGIAKRLIDAAKDAGADAVKFQKRTISDILTKEGLEKPYTSPHAFAPTYGEHRLKLEFGEKEYREIKKYCQEKDILFFASVWDEKSVDFMDALGTDAYKVPSADTINTPLLEYVAKKDKPVLLSTGMNTFEEIQAAVKTVLAHNNKVIIFHCLSLYPSPEEKIELSFMDVLRETFKPLPVGYSGHEIDLLPSVAAVARGAVIIERHFTLDKKMKGSDHAASLEPDEFKELVNTIRRVEKILGNGAHKTMYQELIPLREKLAKSLASKAFIPKGTLITKDMLTVKGPGSGLKPSEIEDIVGRVAEEDIPADSILPKSARTWKK